MALKNVKDVEVNVKYNGITFLLKPGETLDVRDFDVANKDVIGTEKHIIRKTPNTFEQVKSVSDKERDKTLINEIEELKKQNASLRKELDARTNAYNELSNKNAAKSEEFEEFERQIIKLKNENKSLKSKFDEYEDEIKKLRFQVSGGKKEK